MNIMLNASLFFKLRRSHIITVTILGLFIDTCILCNLTEQHVTASNTTLESLTLSHNITEKGNSSWSKSCWLVLDAGDDDLRLLTFVEYNLTCPQQSVYIYDGINNTSATIVKALCGVSPTPNHYSTTQRYAFIEIISDGTSEFEVKLDYIAAYDRSGTGCRSQQRLGASDSYEYLSSPHFPRTYPSDSSCRWLIINPNGEIDIEIIVSDVEDDQPTSCEYDKYQIFDGEYKCENNVLEMACSEYPKRQHHNMSSSGSMLLITFESDGSVNRRGFFLRYKSRDYPSTTAQTTTLKSTTLRLIEESTENKYIENSTNDQSNSIKSTTDDTKTFTNAETKPSESPKRKTTNKYIPKDTRLSDTGLNSEYIYGIAGGIIFLIVFIVVTAIVIIKHVRAPVAKYNSPPSPSLTPKTESDTSVECGKSRKDPKSNTDDSVVKELENNRSGSSLRSDIVRTKYSKDFEPPYSTVIPKSKVRY